MAFAQHGQLLGQLRKRGTARNIEGESGVLENRCHPVGLLGSFAIHLCISCAWVAVSNKLLRQISSVKFGKSWWHLGGDSLLIFTGN
jgi:hypothetical protein